MAADRKGDGHALAPGNRSLVERAQIAWGIEVDAGGARAAQHQAPATNIGEARLRIARVVDAGRDIWRAAVLQVQGLSARFRPQTPILRTRVTVGVTPRK